MTMDNLAESGNAKVPCLPYRGCVLRTVSLRVPIIPNPVGVVGGWSSGQGIGKSRETVQLQLMCCALSELPSSQFTRGQRVLKMDERETRIESV